ncbi:MAG: hypothetical protein BWY75_02349 [bacterium ADurb.Bin425]|nr:MAG: hypothetical protein BWY75_02349 [bacterium ADurb.Bin425]
MIEFPLVRACSVTVPPGGLNLMAFDKRLAIILGSICGSALTEAFPGRSFRLTPISAAKPELSSIAASRISLACKVSGWTLSIPDLIFSMSSKSPIRTSMRLLLRLAPARCLVYFSVALSSLYAPWASISRKVSIVIRGERKSWVTMATTSCLSCSA